jgi:hypothetical protein
MSGKGSVPRPFSVDQETFGDNWDRVFGQKSKIQHEIDAVRRMRDARSEGERQSAAWLKPEHYDHEPTLICPKCGRDRFKESCGLETNPARMIQECPMQGTADATT